MKLEPKHLTPYLQHSLKVVMEGKKCDVAWMSTKNITVIRPNGIGDIKKIAWKHAHLNIKPILRSLSDLTNESWKEEVLMYYADLDIDIRIYNSGNDNKNDFSLSITYKLMDDVFTDLLINRGSTRETQRHFFEWLLENHFDVFGLIEKGLAIDINSLDNDIEKYGIYSLRC